MSKATDILPAGCRVAILSGGASSEKEVSIASGRAVADAARSAGLPVDIFELEENHLPEGLDCGVHLVLPLIHGTYGEDGELSADLDEAGFAYGGCGQAASELCFDKLATKAVARNLGIPVARELALSPVETHSFGKIQDAVGLPFILKPRRDGSSVGLRLIGDASAFEASRENLRRADYIAESFQEGYDLTVGVLDGEPLEVVGVHPIGELYDYEHKYTKGLSEYDAPAKIDDVLRSELLDWSRKLFTSCGCRDIARVDFHKGVDGKVLFLEVNTLPGMTATSLLPKSAQCCGISFQSLVVRWVEMIASRKSGGPSQ